jgi:Ca-activated chloride channel family protein
MKQLLHKKRIKRIGTAVLAAALGAGLLFGSAGCAVFRMLDPEKGGEADGYYKDESYAPGGEYLTMMPIDEPQEPFNTEEYDVFEENRFLSTESHPLSTFAADVDTASYANVRRQLNAGQMPNQDSVRIEEMINYFRYNYRQPKSGEVLAVDMQMTDTPWNQETRLLRVGITAETPPEAAFKDTKNNLVFLIDVSGSMENPDKLPLVQRSFLGLTETLNENDTVSIVTYASQEAVVLDGVNGEEKAAIMTAIENLTAGGSTHGSAGIQAAYKLAEENFIQGGNNRVILATDGDLNVGVTGDGELTRLIEKKRDTGIFLSVLGFGSGNLKDSKMEALADHGNGQYSYIDTIYEARKVLQEEVGQNLVTVAKDVKIQVDFNSAKVAGYRLIGYENRKMAAEDFDDDTKDGGEMGAGHRMTALYELVMPGSGQEIAKTGSKYERKGTDQAGAPESDELLTVNIRYKDPQGDQSKLISRPLTEDDYQAEADDNTKLAASLAAFGMLLRKSNYSKDATYQMVGSLLNELTETDDYVEELKQLVKEAERLDDGASDEVDPPLRKGKEPYFPID